jgi:hypothetical protein
LAKAMTFGRCSGSTGGSVVVVSGPIGGGIRSTGRDSSNARAGV